jgi:hypothetical protein
MKTAVSVPDPVYFAAEEAAKRLAISRSELYTKAIESFLHAHTDAEVTRRLNEVYQSESSSVDPVLLDASLRSIGPDSW